MTAILVARNVVKDLGRTCALDDISLEVRAGEVVALLGPSGSGKSTLIRILHRLVEATSGSIDAPEMRRLSLVQQRPGLFRMRAWENVAFPLRARGHARSAARADAMEMLATLGLMSRAGAHAHDLSGGEAQRVALARALVTNPDALLVDEGTNQLDPEWTRKVEVLLRAQATGGAAVLIVTHSLQQARRIADRFAFLDQGKLVETGPIAALDAPRSDRLRAFRDAG